MMLIGSSRSIVDLDTFRSFSRSRIIYNGRRNIVNQLGWSARCGTRARLTMAINANPIAVARGLIARAMSGAAHIPVQPGTYKVGIGSRAAWNDSEGLELERMTRLTDAQIHLDRSVTAGDSLDRVANWCLSIVLYWSAVECTELGELSWEAVRNRICHIPDPRFSSEVASGVNDPDSSLVSGEPVAQPDESVLPVRSGAIPKLDYRLPPDNQHSSSLGWVIRETKCFLGVSSLGTRSGLFNAWERAVMKVAEDVLCEWDIEQVRTHAALIEGPELAHREPWPTVPDGFADGWSGMDELISTTSGILNQWLWDQIGFWEMVRASLVKRRMEERTFNRGENCSRHCETARWKYSRAICEVFQWNETKCEDESLSPDDLSQRVLEERRSHLPRKPRPSLIYDLPPNVIPETANSST